MAITLKGFQRKLHHTRYAKKAIDKENYLKKGQHVVVLTKDGKYPTRELGKIDKIAIHVGLNEIKEFEEIDKETLSKYEGHTIKVHVKLETADFVETFPNDIFVQDLHNVDILLETEWVETATRVAKAVSSVETTEEKRSKVFNEFLEAISNFYLVPAGRILTGAGDDAKVTLFNCFSGDTIVQTKEGSKLIRDLEGQTVDVLSMDGVYRKAEFKSYGEQELFLVELENGESFEATAGHEWFYKKDGKYKKTTTLDLEGKRIPLVNKDKKLNYEEVVEGIKNGIVYGDGSIEGNTGFARVLLFGEKKKFAQFFEGDHVVPHYKGDYVGVYKLDPKLKELPTEEHSDSYWQGFIIGLIGTDGYVDSRGSFGFHSKSEADLTHIVRNLHRTNFLFTSFKQTRKINPFNGLYSPCYKVQLAKQCGKSEYFIKDSHKEKFDNSPRTSKTNTVKVVKVRPLHKTETVYCCEEPETHSFVIGTGYLTGNCYVIDVEKPPHCPHVGIDSRQAIFHHMGRISEIMARGGGVGTCLSVFRPRYNILSQTKGRSTGAVFIGNMFSSLTQFIEQANRRGAQMLTLHDWHPDVFYTNDENDPEFNEDFIGAKRKPGFMEGNNSSVLISNDFLKAVEEDDVWHLRFPDTTFEKYNEEWDGDLEKWVEKGYPVIIHRTVKARDMWDKIMVSNKTSAEPGILFIDPINYFHNGWYLGKVKATNPCGEQPILGNSTCNLSAVNLGRMIEVVGADEEGDLYEIDWDLLEKTVRTGVRFLDNVIDLSYYFDEDMKETQQGERRLGLGILGAHDLLIALRVRYGSEEGNRVIDRVMEFIKITAYSESINLAKEKGVFPLFDEKMLESGMCKSLPEYIREEIRKYGIRNLTLLTIAPTGTTGSLTPSLLDPEGSVSTGIEPHFAMKYNRKSRVGNTVQYAGVAKAYMDRNPDKELPDYFVGAMDLSPEEHVSVQAVAQKHVCSSISKTINAPRGYTVEQVKEAYTLGHKLGLKGMTIYVDGTHDEQILTLADKDEKESVEYEEVAYVKPKTKGKYDNWECANCGSKDFTLQDGCPTCTSCGAQACSL